MSENALALDNQLCFPLYAASHLVVRLYRPLLDKLGLTYPQYLVLLVLWEHSPATVGDICQHLLLDSGTVTPLLKRLEGMGLVMRVRSKEDERRVHVSLTPEGAALRAQAENIPSTLTCQLALSTTEVSDLRQQLHGLLDRLAAHGM